MKIEDVLRNNPSYPKLKTRLNQDRNMIVFEGIDIYGIPFSLQQTLCEAMAVDLQSAITFISRDSLELRKFVQTIQSIELKSISLTKLTAILRNHGLKRTLKVLEPGNLSLMGDTLTFWPLGYEHPIRASYFDESFEDAYIIDEIYHQRYEKVENIILGDVNEIEEKTVYPNIQIISPNLKIKPYVLIFTGDIASQAAIDFDYSYPQLYFLRFDLLEKEINDKEKEGFNILLFTNNKEAVPKSMRQLVNPPVKGLEAGLTSRSQRFIYLTDRELFGTIFLSKITKRLSSSKARQMLADLEGEIEIDDFIVHEDHGIGIYKGIKQEEYEQKIPLGFGQYRSNLIKEDYILIKYAEEDELYVPLTQISKITKYIAQEGNVPELTRLGKNEWTNYSRRVRADIQKIAKDLVSLYASRELVTAPIMDIEKTEDYQQFCEDFPYEETPDQIRSEKEVLFDLNSKRPMNRLIVGDVGFGKTEIAMRAAYNVAANGFQVAVLCPTTVLVAQHEKVFSERFKNTSFKVAGISRLSKYQNDKVLQNLKQGDIDIIIGTHRLLSADVEYKKLGLLVIDEEQKFGVKQKEKIKKIANNIHILNMSATPIPRTLSMALSSIQEISLIATPPQNRIAIKTKVLPMDWSLAVTAIEKEVQRGGQVYFLHNRIDTIQSVFNKLQHLMPELKITVVHGQLDSDLLGKRITDFYNGKYDCLICTTIIENGIDMPNVNTIIIEHSQNFGLGQLYQLRGRVGRSNRQAYAYLFFEGSLTPREIDPDSQKPKNELKYIKRLKAIMETSDLGSGFKLASKDLEIRGAGNLLGKQQHGHINYMGYGLYMQLLAEEIERQKSATKEVFSYN